MYYHDHADVLSEWPAPEPVSCGRCGCTGVIETGNNDLPCDCPAGAAAMFNDAELGLVSGAQLRAVAAKRGGY